MEEKRGAFIFDLDGTLCNSTERAEKYLSGEEKDWDGFYRDVDKDGEISSVVSVAVALFKAGWDILFVTGRPESCREKTLKWIREHMPDEIANTEHLFMRSAEDGFRADYVTKTRNYRNNIEGKWWIGGVFEDRDQCVRAWRDLGLQCYQVDYGAY